MLPLVPGAESANFQDWYPFSAELMLAGYSSVARQLLKSMPTLLIFTMVNCTKELDQNGKLIEKLGAYFWL